MSLPDALRYQSRACADLGSPFTARVLALLADRLRPGTDLTDRLFDWPGNLGPSGDSVPLRLVGALHGLVLSGKAPDLARCYPPAPAPDDKALWAALQDALQDHADRLMTWLDRAPQTNEVARSAVLIAVGHWLTARHHLPLRLSELGASAGLNLNWASYALNIGATTFGPLDASVTLRPDWTGAPPPDPLPTVTDRRGTDLAPLDTADPDARLRLCAYVWPDQADRLARLRDALALPAAPVDRADAADWLVQRLDTPTPGECHMLFHTVAWQYFPPEVQARARGLIETAGARATQDAPLAWFGMEADDTAAPGAALTLRLWPGDTTIPMGRCDFHGRWVHWTAPDPATGETA